MTRLPHNKRWCQACLGALLLLLAMPGVSAASPKRVLILDPFGRNVAPFTTVVSSFRSTLARELGEPVDIYELPLELARFSGPEGETPLVTFLEGRLKEQPVDLVVPVGTAGMQFAARHRDRLFPTTSVMVLGTEPRMLSPELMRTNATAVAHAVSLPGMVEDILQLRPQTTNIVVVLGASALERFWAERCRREFQVFTNRVGFTWVNDLTMEQILKHCAALPPRSFILHVMFIVDAAGVPCERNEVLRRLHEDANAPVFGLFASEFGLGSMGGRLMQDTEMGAQAAQTAVRLLRGERPERIPVQVLEATEPTYDWRELRRWSISEANLPAGSIIQLRQPTFWEQYRWVIVGTASFFFLQAALIVGLWVNRAQRKQGEAEATLLSEISSKFVNLPPTEVDREIEDALRRVCEFLDLDLATLWQWSDEAPGVFRFTHAYRAQGIPATAEPTGQQQFPWVIGQLRAGRTVAIPSVDKLPAAAAVDQANGRRGGIKSALAIPLSVGGEPPVGALGLNSTRAERNWPDALVKRLEVVAQIFANALARKRAEQVSRENEQRMTLAADAAHFGVWVWNLAPNQVWGSERWHELFGFVGGKDVGFEAVMERVHPDDRETVEREVRLALANRSDYAGEFRAVLPDGTVRWIASRGRGYADANETPIRMVGAAIDITERKHTHEQVRQLSLAVEQSPVSVVITDLQGKILYVNRKFSEVSGYSMSECLGQNPRILKSGESPAEMYQELWACITSGRIWRGEFRNRKKNGDLYWEWAVISPLFDAAGKITHFVGVKEDVTERKRAETEAQELRSSLAHAGRVTLLGQLASALAHELSQPLGAILRNAEAAEIILREPSPDLEEIRAIVADIHADDQRAGQVIDHLRSLLKRRSLDRQPVDLQAVIAEVLSLVQSDANARQVKLVSATEPGLPMVLGDRIHLQQVLLNLLVNAMDALEGCAPVQRCVQVSTHRADPGSVEVRVCDSGPGIPGESPERLFEPFFTTKAKGMGLGLSMSKAIIEAHQGKIWAGNRPEGGACFCFTVPAASEGGQGPAGRERKPD